MNIISRESMNKRDPVNKIILGPIQTLHLPSSALATENWWYDPQYSKPIQPLNIMKDLRPINKFMAELKKYTKNNKLKHFAEEALCEYSEALDYIDWDKSFIKLWSILEYLTDTKHNDRYSETINRASFLFTDREYAKLVLIHLKDYRNQSIHARRSRNDGEALIYQLKKYVERLIFFYIVNKYKLKDRNEVAQFLNQPDDIQLLKKRIKLTKNAIDYIGN